MIRIINPFYEQRCKPMTILDKVNSHASDCIEGKVPVCKHVRLACERHFNDLKRTDIYFDEKAAKKAIDFVQLMRHVKGKWAGKQLILEPWQIFFIGSVFGWKRGESDLRRFREANLTLPRKNAKSTTVVALDQYMLTADEEEGAEVLLAASKEDQAKDLFGIGLEMIRRNPQYSNFYGLRTTTETIRYPKTGSIFRYVVGTPVDGSNPHCGHIDEYHQHKGNVAYEAIKNGMGAREQPLLLIASTAGMDLKAAYYDYTQYCNKVVSGIIDDDSLFSLVYTIDEDDDWQDFSCWAKANPNMGVSVFEDYLKSQRDKAIADVASRSSILTKHLDIWNNESTSWIDLQKWLACGDDSVHLEDFAGEECWMGLDLASRVDLCSLMLVFRKDGKFYVFGRHYLNRDRVSRSENRHLQNWELSGHLTVTEGAQTDFTAVEQDIKRFADMFAIQELAYDPREATFLMQQVREWANFPCIEVPQGPAHFSEPMKVLEAAYLSGDLVHSNDPVLNWAAGNVILKNTSSKLIYPAKRTRDEKIDPIVALIMALSRAEVASSPLDIGVFCL